MATLLQPGRISPLRQVPANIPRPEYVGRARPKTGEPDIKDAETIERMRAAGKLADLGDERAVEPLREIAQRKVLLGLGDACEASAARAALKRLEKR